ncbi:MAG: class I SAM-dependent rRNA methyltransferase [Planctomycetia bacterium]|nr:class I SAM-dependent rRNA methyltransferase [Planctomycetia bacterium]
MTLPQVILRPKRARPFYGRHPWVFPGAIAAVHGEPADGTVVDLMSHEGQFVARGLYNSQSKLRVRLYSWDAAVPLEREFFRARLAAAVQLRREVLKLLRPGAACRLVFSEGDGLSGLTVDCYDRWLVVQFTSLALFQRRELLCELLVELLQPAGIVLRTERGIGQLEGLEAQDGLLWGTLPDGPVVIEEAGLQFQIDLTEGQKTGFYLDQRDNRQAVARYAAGRRVLDAFCYTGAFGLAARRAGAREVVGVDVSEPALALARRNAEVNGLDAVSFIRADGFAYLDSQVRAGERFGLIVLDPPKFARHQQALPEALHGHARLLGLALRLLEPDGILTACCCTGLIDMTMLEDVLAQQAALVGRDVQILERRGQAPDHPVAVSCRESSYLKCLLCRVR